MSKLQQEISEQIHVPSVTMCEVDARVSRKLLPHLISLQAHIQTHTHRHAYI